MSVEVRIWDCTATSLLRRMKRLTKKPKRIRLRWLERFTTLAGLLVVVSVWMESGRELSWAIVTRRWPRHEAVGGALVVIGVFAEVALGIFIGRSAKSAELEADKAIAETRERASAADENQSNSGKTILRTSLIY